MTRIAIVGANGQVGAEVCLRLRAVPDIDVVPVVRNVSGSAFLRLSGMECRHGRISDPQEARRLIGDCDAVVDFALSTVGIPRVDRIVNRSILNGIVAGAKPGATIIFASTIMVYAPGTKWHIPDSYGMEKLRAERTLSRLCRSSRHPLFIFRLGHVLGELQNVTQKIKSEIREAKVALPKEGLIASNSVFATAITEAVVQAAGRVQKPATYDLITSPQWPWRQVYEYYAAQLQLPLILADAKQASGNAVSAAGLLRRSLYYLRRSQALRERLMFILGYFSEELNQKVYARYLQTRAASEIAALLQSQKVEPSVPNWRELRVHAMPQMPDALTLEARYPLQCTSDFSAAPRAVLHPS